MEDLNQVEPREPFYRLFLPSLNKERFMHYGLDGFRQDMFGGMTAAIVALPLALAFGVASGAGPVAGLYGAIAVGFFASVFGGTPAQISGPTGPMTVVMGAVIASHATSLSEAFTIVMLGGLIQILFGILRVGRYIAYTPYSVISGFMTGIGVIILILQIMPFLGLDAAPDGVVGTVRALLVLDIGAFNLNAMLLGVICLASIILWPARLQRFIPAPLAVLAGGVVLSLTILKDVPVIGEVPTGFPSFIMPAVSLEGLPQMVQAAFVLALLGAIDSLLTSLVADSITKTTHDSDKELVGQGVGNMVAGLLGALPGAGATMRTVVNVRAGGRSPVSGILHAAILLLVALGAGPVVSRVPHAVLAAILFKVGWDIIDWGYLRRMRHAPREKFVIMLITFVLTVFVDLIIAVAVGIILTSFVTSRWLSREQLKGLKQASDADALDQLTPAEKELLRSANGKILVTALQGTFSYASARDLVRRASPALTGYRVAIYDFCHIGFIDTSAALAIKELIGSASKNDLYVIVTGLDGEAHKTLNGLGALAELSPEQIIPARPLAIETAVARAGA